MRLSNSKVKTFRRCQRQYRYKYVQKLEKKRKAVQLERGTWLHDLLQHYYDGEDWKEQHKLRTKEFNNLFEEEREDLGDLPSECGRIMRAYLARYKREDKDLVVVDSELDEILTLPNGMELNFIIDLVVEEDGGLWLWDHKTVKSFMDSDFMMLDAQLATYFWAAQKMGYTPLRGIMFNEIRTKPPAIPALLADEKGLSQRKNIDTDVTTYMREIRKHSFDPNDYQELLVQLARKGDTFFKRTRLPKDKPLTRQVIAEMVETGHSMERAERRGKFPRTPDKSCVWMCDFKDICITELFGGDAAPLIKMNFKKRKRPDDLPYGTEGRKRSG